MSTPQDTLATVNKGLSADGVTFIAVCVPICFLSGAAVALRVVGRMQEFGILHKDDWTIMLAWATCLTTVTLSVYWVNVGGVGWPINTLPLAQLETFFKMFYGLELLYVFSVFTVKISLLFLYIRIFNTPRFKLVAYIVLTTCVAWFLASFTIAIVQCTPIQGAWDLTIKAKCMDKQKLIWGVGISNMLLDAIILCLPMPVIWKLQLNTQRKAGLTFIFLTGSIVCLSSILRVTSIGIINKSDFTKSVFAASLWSSIEANVAVTAACLPTLNHIFLRFKRQFSTSYPSRGRSRAYDPERSNLTGGSGWTMKSKSKSKRGLTNLEMSDRMAGWHDKSGMNEAYTALPTPRVEDAAKGNPFDGEANVVITTKVTRQVESREGLR